MFQGYTSTVINAPIETVWNQIKDFNGLSEWHPMIQSSRIEEGYANGAVGCIRELTLKDGGEKVREQLLGYSSVDYSIVYNILESNMPVSDYISTMRLRPVVDGNVTFLSGQLRLISIRDMMETNKQIFLLLRSTNLVLIA